MFRWLGNRLILNHFSSEPFELVDMTYENTSQFKPEGLWLCKDNAWYDYAIHGVRSHEEMKYKTSFEVDMSNVRLIKNHDELFKFHNSFPSIVDSVTELLLPGLLNWKQVAKQYDGVIISPYKKIGFNTDNYISWHEAWDVASGCFWNLKCLRMIECYEQPKPNNIQTN